MTKELKAPFCPLW